MEAPELEEDPWRTPEELLDHFMQLSDYYKDQLDRITAEKELIIQEKEIYRKKCEDYETRLRKMGVPGPAACEEEKLIMCKRASMIVEQETVRELMIEGNGAGFFFFNPGDKNPPIERGTRVYIIGEMTRGKFIELRAVKKGAREVYGAYIEVKAGYKYTFCFKIGDNMTTDTHFPMYMTPYGRGVNYVYVVDPNANRALEEMKTYSDAKLLPVERQNLLGIYSMVIPIEELPQLETLRKEVGNLYFALEEPPGLFRFQDVAEGSMIQLQRLTDQNFIPLHSSNRVVASVSMEHLNSCFALLEKKEYIEKMKELRERKLNVLYQVEEDSCWVVGVTPEGSLSDYDVEFDLSSKTIKKVRSNKFGEVAWTSEKVDSEFAFLSINPVEIFGQELDSDVYNLLHVHIAGVGDSATVDLQYLRGDVVLDYRMGKDATGAELKYKILIQNNVVRAVLYNHKGTARELKFKETRFQVGEIVNVMELRMPNVSYARIVGIPVQTLASFDQDKLSSFERTAPSKKILSMCKTRYFEELPGYIDVELIPGVRNKPKELVQLSVPICQCMKAPEGDTVVAAVLLQWKEQEVVKIKDMIREAQKVLGRYSEKGSKMGAEEKKEVLGLLQNHDAQLLTFPSEDCANPEVVQEVTQLLKDSSLAQRRLAMDIRLSKLK